MDKMSKKAIGLIQELNVKFDGLVSARSSRVELTPKVTLEVKRTAPSRQTAGTTSDSSPSLRVQEDGCSRSLTKKFFQLRKVAVEDYERESGRIVHLFKSLSFSKAAAAVSSTSTGSSPAHPLLLPNFSVLTDLGSKLVQTVKPKSFLSAGDPERPILPCPLCNRSVPQKEPWKTCPICESVVCGNCISRKLRLERLPSVEGQTKFITKTIACDHCRHIVCSHRRRDRWKEEAKNLRSDRFIRLCEDMSVNRDVLSRRVLRFRVLVGEVKDRASPLLQEAQEELVLIGKMLNDLHQQFIHLSKFKFEKHAMTRLWQGIVRAFSEFLQHIMPQFHSLQKQLQASALQMPVASSVISSEPVVPPRIKLVNPAFSPLSGGVRIHVTGEDFKQGVQVYINNTCCSTFYKDSCSLFVFTPPSTERGLAEMKFVNPDGGYDSVQLLYDDIEPLPPTTSAPRLTPCSPRSPREPIVSHTVIESSMPDYTSLEISRVDPVIAQCSGGTRLILCGFGFRPGMRVQIGGVNVLYKFITHDTLTIVAPPHGPGNQDIELMLGSQRAILSDVLYYSAELPDLNSLPLESTAPEVLKSLAESPGQPPVFRPRGTSRSGVNNHCETEQ